MIDTKAISPSPAELADLLDQAAAVLAHDGEVAAVLREARNNLRTLSWNRYAHRQTRASARRAFARRHGHAGRRIPFYARPYNAHPRPEFGNA